MKTGVILLAHGSKREEAQQELVQLADELKEEFDCLVKAANQEFTEPDFFSALDELVETGVNRVLLIPLFVFSGKHIQEDIPELIAQAKQKYSNLELITQDYLAQSNDFKKLLIKRIKSDIPL